MAQEVAYSSTVRECGGYALEWLEKQAYFTVAKQATDIDAPRDLPSVLESIIRSWNSSKYQSSSPHPLPIRYLDFISGIGNAAHRHFSGQSLNEARYGAETLKSIKSKLLAIEGLLANNSLPDDLNAQLSDALNIQRTVWIIEREAPLIAPASRRNDSHLPARLMAAELIWHHELKFGDPFIKAVSNLLELFFKDSLEKRTLQRLVISENEQAVKRAKMYKEQWEIEDDKIASMPPPRTVRAIEARLESERFRAAYKRPGSFKP